MGSSGILVCSLTNEFTAAVSLETGFAGVLEIGFGELILRPFTAVGVLVVHVLGFLTVLGDFVAFDVVDFGSKA